MTESPFDNIKFPRFDELPFRKGDPDSKFGVYHELHRSQVLRFNL